MHFTYSIHNYYVCQSFSDRFLRPGLALVVVCSCSLRCKYFLFSYFNHKLTLVFNISLLKGIILKLKILFIFFNLMHILVCFIIYSHCSQCSGVFVKQRFSVMKSNYSTFIDEWLEFHLMIWSHTAPTHAILMFAGVTGTLLSYSGTGHRQWIDLS